LDVAWKHTFPDTFAIVGNKRAWLYGSVRRFGSELMEALFCILFVGKTFNGVKDKGLGID
jgi:hypothetical protein